MQQLSRMLSVCVFLLLSWYFRAAADCVSYGVDFVDGGSYFINTASPDDFNFTSYFEGCAAGGFANTFVVPPDTGDIDYCSNIPISPDDVDYTAVCNQSALEFELKKADMVSGSYILGILSNNEDAEPFAYTRNVYITAGTQTTLTATPTVTIPVFVASTITITLTTDTETQTDTAPTPTITTPSLTIERTRTITPSKVTVWTTMTHTRSKVSRTRTIVPTTVTVRPPCIQPPRQDLPLTAMPPGVHDAHLQSVLNAIAAANGKGNSSTARRPKLRPRANGRRAFREFVRREAELAERGIARRSPDNQYVTVIETTYIAEVTTTSTLPPFTDTAYATTTTTTTLTPAPVIIVKGKTVVYDTVTAPTPTKTRTTRVRTTTLTTSTVTITKTFVVTRGWPTPCW